MFVKMRSKNFLSKKQFNINLIYVTVIIRYIFEDLVTTYNKHLSDIFYGEIRSKNTFPEKSH